MDYPADFEKLWQIYPRRDWNNPKKLAYIQWKRRIKEGAKQGDMESAVRVYYGYCHRKGIIGTDKVMMTATFLGPNERWQPFVEAKGGDCSGPNVGAAPVTQPPKDLGERIDGKGYVAEILRGLAASKKSPTCNYERKGEKS